MVKLKGFTLLEILISLTILSLILLNFSLLQIKNFQQSKINYYFLLANEALNSMADRIKLLKENLTTEEMINWNHEIKIMLPQGLGTVSKHADYYRITINFGSYYKNLSCNQIEKKGCLFLDVPINS